MDKCHQWFHPSQWWEHTVILTNWRSRRRRSFFGFRLSTYLVSVEIFQPCVTLERLSIIFWSPSINRRGNSGEKKGFERQIMPPSIQCTICKKICCTHQNRCLFCLAPITPPPTPSILPLGASGDIWDFRLTGQRGSHVTIILWHCISENPAFDFYKNRHGSHKQQAEMKNSLRALFFDEKYSSTKGFSSVTAVCCILDSE